MSSPSGEELGARGGVSRFPSEPKWRKMEKGLTGSHCADLRWLDWERWSQRQSAAMKLGGLVGSLTLEGDVSPFAPLLRAAEILHAGKGAVFGLGKVEVG